MDNRNLFYSVGILLGVVLFAVFGTKLITDNVSSLNDQLAQNRDSESKLQAKLNSLSEVSSLVTTDSQVAIDALPEKNPVLSVLSNIRSSAASFGLTLNNVSSGEIVTGSSGAGLSSSEIIFETDGDYKNLTSLIDIIKSTSPVTIFDSIKVTSQSSLGGDTYRFVGHLFTYWASLPTTIPSVTQSFEGLTDEEQQILTRISALKPPPVGVSLIPSSSSAQLPNSNRSDPFSL